MTRNTPDTGAMLVDSPVYANATRRCLAIQEVVRHICQMTRGWSDEDTLGYGFEELRALAHLGRTCKAFKEPALDVLWMDLPGLYPLIMSMPRDLWEVNAAKTEMRFLRSIHPTDWTLFLRLATRVRYISIWDTNDVPKSFAPSVSLDILRALSLHRPTLRLLPNLRALEWFDNRPETLEYCCLLIGPNLSSMALNTKLEGHDWDRKLTAAYQTLSDVCCLKSISGEHYHDDARSPRHSDALVNAFSDMIIRMGSLSELYGPTDIPLREDAVVFLSSLSDLDHIVLNLTRIKYLPDLSQPCFVGLSSVNVHLLALDLNSPIFGLLSEMCPGALRDFTISIRGACPPDILHHLLEVLAPQYEKLVRVCVQADRLVNEDGDDPPMVDLDVVRPLLALKQMEHFYLSVTGLSFDDAAIEVIARHWPNLEDLGLGPPRSAQLHHTSLGTPRATLQSLRTLSRYCPKLESLGLYFDATKVELGQQSASEGADGPGAEELRLLNVYSSPIKDQARVASILADCFPQLRVINYTPVRRAAPIPMPRGRVTLDRWKEACELLPVFAETRAEVRARFAQGR